MAKQKFNPIILVRIVLISIYALLVLILIKSTMPDDIQFKPKVPPVIIFIFYLLIFNLNIEGNLWFDRYLNKKLPWFYFPRKRLFIQLSFIFMYTFITIGLPFTIWYFHNGQSLVYPPFSVVSFASAILFLLAFLGISLTINFFKQWKSAMLETEQLKQEKLKADYKVLQNQINPHFLFNNLNALISEIKYDSENAVDFAMKLSKVYRYVLQSKNYEIITLEQEMNFIRSYIFLQKVRAGNALNFDIHVDKDTLSKKLPPLTLQILLENAINHNIFSHENPLNISIESINNDTLIIKNPLIPRENVNSTQIGLSNIKNRYKLLDKEGFKWESTQTEFVVSVPLIQ